MSLESKKSRLWSGKRGGSFRPLLTKLVGAGEARDELAGAVSRLLSAGDVLVELGGVRGPMFCLSKYLLVLRV